MRTGRPPVPIKERFKTKYIILANGCWEWLGAKDNFGYGFIKSQKGIQLRAHRVSWELAKGPIPNGLFVLHVCDNKKCVNPEHLFLGTGQDNMNDMVHKGRSARNCGEKNGMCKLTLSQVLEIRNAIGSQSEIGKRFNVSQTTIGCIKRRKKWMHV